MTTAETQSNQLSSTFQIRRARVLSAINRLNYRDFNYKTRNQLLIRCAEIILLYSDFCGGWVGRYSAENAKIIPITFFLPLQGPDGSKELYRKRVILEPEFLALAEQVLKERKRIIRHNIEPPLHIPLLPGEYPYQSFGIWPLWHNKTEYGVLAIFSALKDGFPKLETDFLENCISDLSLTLFTQDIAQQLKFERDFNTEIIDSIQALMVSITPCGQILRFNREAERITGYREQDIINKYWVDVLLSPEHRTYYQNVVSELLKSNRMNISFRAPLRTREGRVRTIDWHSSIKSNIEEGKVGMVLFGLDITDKLAADLRYDRAKAKWENIFSTIQDPALIVDRSGIILDANHATFTASRKKQEEVIGQSVCQILHGGSEKENECPLELLIASGRSRILNTSLNGLHGDYLLTISPLKGANVSEEATLLVARDMTEEEHHKAEAIRAAQLASIGELAAGVAHEINNPVNGILNYAQMLRDLIANRQAEEIIVRIIDESKRIAGIVRNLLDFSRHRVEEPEPLICKSLLLDCLELVNHQLRKDGILVEVFFDDKLPLIYCNASQVRQVFLNIISNSRYALNERFSDADLDKKLVFHGSLKKQGKTPYVRVTIKDFGTGIEHRIIDRVFDPFFSTKPEGKGTGLGLSISYGLIRDNGGYMKIKSHYGSHTVVTVDLPTVSSGGKSNVNS